MLFPGTMFEGVLIQNAHDELDRKLDEEFARERREKHEKHMEMLTRKDIKNAMLAGSWALSNIAQAPSASTASAANPAANPAANSAAASGPGPASTASTRSPSPGR